MSFSIDRQSLDELNLMGKFRQGSVYFLFNQVKTRGGEKLLDTLFKTPLTDAHRINERTAIFQFFQDHSFQFPFDSQQVTLMREYVDAASDQGRFATYSFVLIKKLLSALTRDERYKTLIQGLQATIVCLKKCYAFAKQLILLEGPYKKKAVEVARILNIDQLAALINTDIYKAISVETIAEYDYILKSKFSSEIQIILEFIAETDVYISVAHVAEIKGFTYARALPKQNNSLKAVDLKHPCIENGIGNTIEMREQHNVIFLTGANMAGKSTWMKSIGIGVYLAHIGFPIAAKFMEFSIREGLYSSINVADNIELGYSHFYAEVVRVKNAADATSTGKHLLLMFDELFKGTNVKDAYDGTLAVTEAFSEYVNCLFIVSTHIIEVGEALKNRSNIQFAYMPTFMEGTVPKYTYQLKTGITEDRQGMMIIRNERILEIIGNSNSLKSSLNTID